MGLHQPITPCCHCSLTPSGGSKLLMLTLPVCRPHQRGLRLVFSQGDERQRWTVIYHPSLHAPLTNLAAVCQTHLPVACQKSAAGSTVVFCSHPACKYEHVCSGCQKLGHPLIACPDLKSQEKRHAGPPSQTRPTNVCHNRQSLCSEDVRTCGHWCSSWAAVNSIPHLLPSSPCKTCSITPQVYHINRAYITSYMYILDLIPRSPSLHWLFALRAGWFHFVWTSHNCMLLVGVWLRVCALSCHQLQRVIEFKATAPYPYIPAMSWHVVSCMHIPALVYLV